MRPFRLFKKPNNEECDKLLWLTRYLYSIGTNIRPKTIQERLFPAKVATIPAIEITSDGAVICGYQNIINYYSRELAIESLELKVEEFKKNNPDYRITDS
jgi:hypothetical protein